MGGLSKSHLASLAALGLAGMGPTSNGALNPTGTFRIIKFKNLCSYIVLCPLIIYTNKLKILNEKNCRK